MANRPLTLLVVHAHPDDEATGTGGILARYAAEGIRTVLVTCTDGRCGDGPGGVKPGEPGHDPEAVAVSRRKELDASCAALGVAHLELLDYRDSGMIGWASNDEAGSFWSTPVDEAAARLADLMRAHQPDVVVTYDPNGFYGHPDHIQAHRATVAALATLPDSARPAKFYWTTVPRSKFEEFEKLARESGADWDDDPGASEDIGLPDDEVTTWVDVSAYTEQKFAALAAHASQEENIFFLRLGREAFAALMGVETFVRVQDTTGASTPEDDLFAGLR